MDLNDEGCTEIRRGLLLIPQNTRTHKGRLKVPLNLAYLTCHFRYAFIDTNTKLLYYNY